MQISVVAASIKNESLKPDEGKTSMRTTIGHGLVGPKSQSVSFESIFSMLEREAG